MNWIKRAHHAFWGSKPEWEKKGWKIVITTCIGLQASIPIYGWTH